MKFEVIAALAATVCCAPSATAQTTAAPVAATPGPAVVAQPVPQVTTGSLLPSNTDIWVALDRKLDSHDVKVGDPLTFKVARDVMLGNYIVIPRGTPANGRVSYRSGRGAFGKSAKLEFDVDTISVAGHPVPVSGHFRIEGNGNTGATIGAVAAAGLIGGVFVKGKSATAAEGSEWKVSTKEPVAVTVGAGSWLSCRPRSASAGAGPSEPIGRSPHKRSFGPNRSRLRRDPHSFQEYTVCKRCSASARP